MAVIAPIFQHSQPDAPQNTQPQPAAKTVTVSTPTVAPPQSKTSQNPPLKRFSINNNLENASSAKQPTENQSTQQAQAQKTVRQKAFSQEELSAAWATITGQLNNEEVHVKKGIERCLPTLQAGNIFLLKAENKMQEDDVLKLKGEILSILRNTLANDLLDFTTSTAQSVIQRHSTPQDRLKEMLSENEHFRRLAEELSLEV